MTLSTVSAGLALGLVRYAAQKGADPAQLWSAAGVTLADDVTDARLPLDAYKRLMRAAKEMTGDPAFALNYGAEISMSEVSIIGLIMEASGTMGEAFAQMQRYGRLAVEFESAAAGPNFELAQRDGRVFMKDCRAEADDFHELTESAFARLVCGPRRFLPAPHILSVHVRIPEPDYAADYQRIFQCPVTFSAGWNALEVEPAATSWTVARHPRYVFGALTTRADQMLADLGRAQSVRGQLETALMRGLHQGEASADAMAAALGFSRQTLFRRLKLENTTYADVLDGLRRRLSEDYLRGGRVSANEVAFLVGFSDPAAFSRAFKRWTGDTPGAFREAHKTMRLKEK